MAHCSNYYSENAPDFDDEISADSWSDLPITHAVIDDKGRFFREKQRNTAQLPAKEEHSPSADIWHSLQAASLSEQLKI